MALTRVENQVTWSASNSVSVTSGSNQTSDAVSLDATCVQSAITCKADNAGTPAAGDIINFYWASSAGDPDGAGTIEYPTDVVNMIHLCRIDTNDTDADSKTVSLPNVPYRGKVYALSGASANAITVSATIEEMRSS